MRASLALLAVLVATPALAAPLAPAVEGRRLREAGRHADARKLLESSTTKTPTDLEARMELGLVYRETGERTLEKAIWNRFYDDYDASRIDRKNARQLTFVALAARYLGGTEDANDTFRDAVAADPKGKDGARANIEWAALFLEKYDAGHAEVSLVDALKILPDDPDAHALMARVKLEQGYDYVAAERESRKALAVDKTHAGARAILAEMHVDAERYDDALAECALILKAHPASQRAHELRAAIFFLRDDRAGYDAERQGVLLLNPRASSFYHGVAELLVKAHRYEEANQLEEEAIKLDSKDAIALAALGSNLLRLGEDAQGLDALRRAWDRDRYNVRTYNLLNLYEDVIAKSYTFFDAGPLRFRVPGSERALIEKHVAPVLRREYDELAARYKFKPRTPVTVELFQKPEHYAVRTVGLPGLDAIAVTFGRVVTGMSPTLGRFNWGMALWHEIAHVFAIQLSKGHVPRWFTEGLSEYETARKNPEWSRHTYAELARAADEGRLLSVDDLNRAFIQSRGVSQIVVAYHQSAEVVTFIAKKWGFDKIVDALKLFADGKDTKFVIRAITGLEVAAFDAAFRAELMPRLAVYKNQFFVTTSEYADIDRLKERVDANAKDTRARGLYALALIKHGRAAEAEALLGKTAPSDKEGLLAFAYLALGQQRYAVAKGAIDSLIAAGGDGYDARMLLATIAMAQKNNALARPELERAKAFDPDRGDPSELLGKILLDVDEPAALTELERAARLDPMDAKSLRLLLERYRKKGDPKRAQAAAERLRFISLDDDLLKNP